MSLLPTVTPLLAFAAVLLAPPARSVAAPDAERPLYLDTAQPVEKRVEDLIGRLTIEEKIGQLMNAAPAIPRLGVPEYDWWNECLHGVARNGIATVFPQAIGMAATWNVDLIREEADVISTEAPSTTRPFVEETARSTPA
jgi:beta-glucosidase